MVLTRALDVGRQSGGLDLSDQSVSRRHLRLVPSPVALSLVDLESRNGTFVNGTRVDGRVVLEQGDVVRLGATEILVIGRRERAPAPAAMATVLAGAGDAVPPPPPPPAVPTAPSRLSVAWDRALGRTSRTGEALFPVYTEMRSRVPLGVWRAVRVVSVLAYVALVVALFVRPAGGLFAFFDVIVPLLPILFFVAPGLWRNICPLAAVNQAPRVLGFTRGSTIPSWWQRRAFIVAMVLFFGIAGARLAVFNDSGPATGVLLAVIISSAFLGGFLFKGKSGWCSQICPLLPLQRVYGQTPLIRVPNSHCQPCVACTKNCYDFQPISAYQADLHEDDPVWTAPRKLFVAALPGFVLGFFTLVGTSGQQPLTSTYGELALFFLGSVGLFYAAEALLPLRTAVTIALWASAAITIFYWFAGVVLASSFATITGLQVPWLRWLVLVVVLVLSVFWIARTAVKARQYDEEVTASQRRQLPVVPASQPSPGADQQKGDSDGGEVRFAEAAGPVSAEAGTSLLEVAERTGLPLEAGCRMGVCGADPVAVLDGASCLSAPEEEELNTLRRLGFATNTRMACSARIESGAVTVSLTPEPGTADDGALPREFDRSIVSVVVLGNGIAGVTAADFVRRGHPECEIHVVGQEPHVLYNRMGISRLVYGRSAMQGLFLLPEQWYDEHQITAWLNTVATRIDLESRRVLLGTGDVLPYDRLILATGSSSVEPPVTGFGRPGSFVLRSATDAAHIRAYAQQHASRDAVVSGGGLLGLEAAHSLLELGLRVTVLERGARLLSRQIDARCSELVDEYFRTIGLQVLYGAEAVALAGEEQVTGVTLKDRRALRCDLFLAAVGIRPNVDLAKRAGIPVDKGVVVDDRMWTGVPGVYAAGDVAEHGGRVLGLWPVAAKQGEIAAVNALGGDEVLRAEVPATILKGVGLDLFSIGRVQPEPEDEVVVAEDTSRPSYRRLVISQHRVVGGIVLGHHPEDVVAVTSAVKKQVELDDAVLAALRSGNWQVLKDVGRRSPVPQPARA